jgi:hypothetical protein
MNHCRLLEEAIVKTLTTMKNKETRSELKYMLKYVKLLNEHMNKNFK